jgi:putative acetyltransferase
MPDLQPRIRAATNADGPAVRALVFIVLAEYGLFPDPAATDADLDDLEACYWASGGSFSVLVSADQVVGCVGIVPVEAGVCELRKMYLSRCHRGRGLGRALLDHALAEARRRGFARVRLETASVLQEAIALYVRNGFRPFSPGHLAARCDQAFILDLDGDRA